MTGNSHAWTMIMAVVLVLFGATTSWAQVAGDTCATAGTITQDGVYPFDTTGASGDGPCAFFNPDYRTVWYEIVPQQSGYVLLSTCGASVLTNLAIYNPGACPTSCSDLIVEENWNCGMYDELTIPVTAGMSYPLAIRSIVGDNDVAGDLTVKFVVPEYGDPVAAGFDCASAGILTGDSLNPFDITIANVGQCVSGAEKVVYYKFTAPTEGYVFADLCDTTFDPFIRVYKTDDCGALCSNFPTFADDGCAARQPFLSFGVVRGEDYIFAVSGDTEEDVGTGTFAFAFVPVDLGFGEGGPHCDSATVIDGPGLYEFDTTNAPANDTCRGGRRSLWFQYTPEVDGYMELETCGSSFDTYLLVAEGESCPASCSDIDYSNNNSCGEQSQLGFFASAGETYHIAIQANGSSDVGPGMLSVELFPEIIQAGDTCETAGVLTVDSVLPLPFDTTGASANDPCLRDGPTVFYEFTAPQVGRVYAEILNAESTTHWLIAYEKDSCTLTCDDVIADGPIPPGPDDARMTFLAQPGQTYLLAISGLFESSFGPGEFSFRFDPNDDGTSETGGTCADPQVVTEGSYPFDTSLLVGTDPCAGPARGNLWYEYTAPADGVLSIDSCASFIDTALVLYPAGSCPSSCGQSIVTEFSSCGSQAGLMLNVMQGESFLISVVAQDDDNPGGPGMLTIGFRANDEVLPGTPVAAGQNCATAGLLNENSSNPFDTTGGVESEGCAGIFEFPSLGNPKAWFYYTAPQSGTMVVDLCGSTIDTMMTVYQNTPCQAICPDLFASTVGDICGGQASMALYAQEGETYTFVVTGQQTDEAGPGIFNFQFFPDEVVLPDWDINGDGLMNVADVTELANLIEDGNAPSNAEGDVNGDDTVDALDVQALAELIVAP